MDSFSIHLKGKPEEEIQVGPLLASDALRQLKTRGLDRVVAVKIDGESRDLSSQVGSQAELEPIYLDSDEGLEILRHSTSHVMAMAVKELFPGVKVTIGPAIQDGFYYDFDYERTFKEEDLPVIEEKMKEIIKANIPFTRREVASREAVDFFKDQNEDYKVELINDLDTEMVSFYTQGSFTDLCRGPHIPSTG
ncbi:MAG TPA: threonine--tRNA ligase, partial [Desulfobacteraceae bacterium]|nr:threonine--tRNA ligase [Desulfobacteraceae bacterium]